MAALGVAAIGFVGLPAKIASAEIRAKSEPSGELLSELRVLAWNVFLRPESALLRDRQFERTEYMPEHLASHEVLVLAEAFDDGARRKLVDALADTHPHVSRVVGRDNGLRQDGGVLVLSQWPIEAEDAVLYSDCAGSDCIAEKGAAYVKIRKGERLYHIFATHLQARVSEIRERQLKALREFIGSKQIPSDEPVLIAGDLNINRDSQEFNRALDLLGASCPPSEGHPYTSDPQNELVSDRRTGSFLDYVLYLNDHLRPRRAVLETRIFQGRTAGGRTVDLSDHYAVLGRLEF